MSTQELASAFVETLYPVAEYAAYVLSKDCAEEIVLAPLGRYPQVAAYAARSMATAPSSYIRCVACLIPAFTPDCEPGLLWDLWRNELDKRDNPPDSIREDIEAADADPEAFGLPLDPEELGLEPGDSPAVRPIEERVAFVAGLEANSVAERLTISAVTFLGRGPEHRDAACRVLRDMVERAVNGQAWADAHFALALLVRSDHPDASGLLSRAAAIGDQSHLATWARQIAAGQRDLLDEPMKLLGPPPADAELPDEHRAELDAMVEAARRLEESID